MGGGEYLAVVRTTACLPACLPSTCRLSKELSSRELQHVVVGPADSSAASKLAGAAASAAVTGYEAARLAAGQSAAVPAVLSTEAAASAVVGTGAGAAQRRGWFGRLGKGKGKARDGKALAGGVEQDGAEDKSKEEPVKVGRGGAAARLGTGSGE